ncbi:MAG TPA: MBL fold metallo-hydrolase [Anaerolineae bacterium]|nr:MBL fold metallo-hydrolase [Anaerolineae bacterium]
MEIIPQVHLLSGSFVNFYLIDEPDGLTLIDTGLAQHFKVTLHAIKQLDRSPVDLKRIILTHSDGDHVGALADLKAICGARAYASPIEAQAIEKAKPSREVKRQGLRAWLFKLARPFFKTKPAHIDELLNAGQALSILGGLRVINTPGHTPGHISLYAPAAQILFCGDSMVAEKDGTLRCSRGANTWDEAQAKESVKIQAALGATIVCSGHGPIVREAAGKFPL